MVLALVFLAACSQPTADVAQDGEPAPPADAFPVSEPAPAEPSVAGDLSGTSWLMNDAPANTAPMITFAEAGHVSGTTGCNTWSASYSQLDMALSFDNLTVTERACMGGAMETETEFLQALRDTQGAHMDGEDLVLVDIGGGENARFHRAN
jgi:heat shock protein HslJ